ncbi:MAG TPA: N-acylglucosamine 2-epimerase, partial [Deltaproteobacteria bacterium]|nr:N-acylglucosamine 2-epimerase [Deltaproteobacteria bacterium]
MPTPSNRLASQASPYLARHAAHPVDWYPWGAEAFTAAQARDCPILLSIGDATSPPCRVLEREHLENEQLAERMNRQYVNIKVDRETRPDLDMLYRTAAKALLPDCSEWPVAVFLTPDGAPFHAGVLVSSAHGQDHYSFPLLDHVDLAWRTQRADLAQVASGIRDVLKRSMLPPPLCSAQNDWTRTVAEHDLPRKKAPEQAERDAPKHPSHGVLSALLVEWHLRRAPRVRTRITRALHEAQTETHDWLAGGFVHPSRPVEGAAPLLIKGLDENAALAALYANAARAFGSAQWAQVAIETCEFVRRALQLESGGVCTAIEIDPGLEDG